MSNNSVPLKRIAKVRQRLGAGFEIDAFVGGWNRGAKNAPADVETVQLLLEHVAKNFGNNAVDPFGEAQPTEAFFLEPRTRQ